MTRLRYKNRRVFNYKGVVLGSPCRLHIKRNINFSKRDFINFTMRESYLGIIKPFQRSTRNYFFFTSTAETAGTVGGGEKCSRRDLIPSTTFNQASSSLGQVVTGTASFGSPWNVPSLVAFQSHGRTTTGISCALPSACFANARANSTSKQYSEARKVELTKNMISSACSKFSEITSFQFSPGTIFLSFHSLIIPLRRSVARCSTSDSLWDSSLCA